MKTKDPAQVIENRLRIAATRQQKLAVYETLRRNGLSAAVAARQAGCSPATAWRYQQRIKAGGPLALLNQKWRCGRKNTAELYGVDARIVRQVAALARQFGSARAGWEAFARQPDCPPLPAGFIRLRAGRSLPPSFHNLLRPFRPTLNQPLNFSI